MTMPLRILSDRRLKIAVPSWNLSVNQSFHFGFVASGTTLLKALCHRFRDSSYSFALLRNCGKSNEALTLVMARMPFPKNFDIYAPVVPVPSYHAGFGNLCINATGLSTPLDIGPGGVDCTIAQSPFSSRKLVRDAPQYINCFRCRDRRVPVPGSRKLDTSALQLDPTPMLQRSPGLHESL